MNKTKIEFAELAAVLKFQFSETELEKIVQEYLAIEQKLSLIKAVDTTDVLPMNFIHPICQSNLLRADVPVDHDPQEVFANCTSFSQNMVVIKNETK